MDNNEKSIIAELKDLQKNMPDIILPSMGILETDNKLLINNDEFINKGISEEN